MRAVESLAAWAARVAPTLDAAGWRDAERDALQPRAPLQRGEVRRWTAQEAGALLAERDRVAADIVTLERKRLCDLAGVDYACVWSELDYERLERLKLVAFGGDSMVGPRFACTDFGREIARVLTLRANAG